MAQAAYWGDREDIAPGQVRYLAIGLLDQLPDSLADDTTDIDAELVPYVRNGIPRTVLNELPAAVRDELPFYLRGGGLPDHVLHGLSPAEIELVGGVSPGGHSRLLVDYGDISYFPDAPEMN
jgi:hypothetical protein